MQKNHVDDVYLGLLQQVMTDKRYLITPKGRVLKCPFYTFSLPLSLGIPALTTRRLDMNKVFSHVTNIIAYGEYELPSGIDKENLPSIKALIDVYKEVDISYKWVLPDEEKSGLKTFVNLSSYYTSFEVSTEPNISLTSQSNSAQLNTTVLVNYVDLLLDLPDIIAAMGVLNNLVCYQLNKIKADSTLINNTSNNTVILSPGTLNVVVVNSHIYEANLAKITLQMDKRGLRHTLPGLNWDKTKDIFDLEPNDLFLVGYKAHQLIELYAKEQSPALERLLLWSILRSKLTEPQLDLLNHIIQQQQRFKRKLIRADFQPLKQSSLKTMFSQFAVHWLQATQDKDISSFSDADFEDLYGEMLLLKKETTRATLQKRLQKFHHKQTLFFNAPTVDLDNLIQVKICRTALISPHIFHHMLEQLENTQNISIQDKNIFKLIFILGFRVGLRINETLNIFVRDLFISEDAVIITIRNNRNKNQKSYSAYRKIPLHHLLKADELHAFKTYSQNRKRLLKEQRKSVTQPLFLKQSLEETHENEVNALLKQLIQSASGEHSFTYHTLRHSAFNHLYLVLKHSPLADAFTDYTPNDQLRIRYALLRNKNTQQTWYALSHFAGHLTPETTCSSYLHLMHLAISYQLNQMHSPLPKEAYFNILKHDDAIKYPVQQRAIKQFLFDQLTKDRYRQHDHQYKPEQQKSPDSLMLGAHDSEMTFELLHHILAVEKEQDLLLPEAIPLQIAQKLRARALHLKTSCVNQKKSSRLFTTDFLRKTPAALVTMLPTNQEEKKVIHLTICARARQNGTRSGLPQRRGSRPCHQHMLPCRYGVARGD